MDSGWVGGFNLDDSLDDGISWHVPCYDFGVYGRPIPFWLLRSCYSAMAGLVIAHFSMIATPKADPSLYFRSCLVSFPGGKCVKWHGNIRRDSQGVPKQILGKKIRIVDQRLFGSQRMLHQ